jgi:hypothetical protein
MAWRIIGEGEIPSLPLGRLKNAFRIQHDHDDDLLRHLSQVAKQYIETYTHNILGDVRLELTLDRWEKTKQPWSGLTVHSEAPAIWIPLPIGPMRTLESVSIRNQSGDWTDVPLEHFITAGHRLGIRADWPPIASGIQSIRITGRGGLTPISQLIEGVWLNLVRCLYDSDIPDMAIVYAALAPLQHFKPKGFM